MQIEPEANRLILRDNPRCYWFLGAFLIAAGTVVLLMTAGLIYSAGELSLFETLFAVVVGLVSVVAGVQMVHRAPTSRVDFDFERRVATIKRRRLFSSQVIHLTFEEIYDFAVDEKRHSDDSSLYRAAVILDGGQVIPLSELWLHDRAWVKSTIHRVSQTLTAASMSK